MLPLVIHFQKNSASNAQMGKTEQFQHGLANWGGWGRWCDSFNLVLLARVCVYFCKRVVFLVAGANETH